MIRAALKILKFSKSLLNRFNEQFGRQCKVIKLVLYFHKFQSEYRVDQRDVGALCLNPAGR
ncbi:hypothetical protein BA171_00530 [Candidatus Hamiltonella defensa (Bemisia tabaci)]|uniref:Uncharacterized protein n=1 Tax=Candidatus Hamiltonella defensa (Bemisia tabaci) TaxID=672795 RepID=A0A249DVY8_9ENTR|nr:hypothetical protein BA171_00530 [Candidatus Hamiltonella defensa (Bemisia tabaci)]